MRIALLLLLAAAMPSRGWSQAPQPPTSDAEPVASADLPLPLRPARDEAGDDQVTAAALLAHGRILQRRRDSLGALRRFQRAYRYDSERRGRKEIVALAMELGRSEDAARYALQPGSDAATDSITFRRLALDATNRSDWKQAASLYEASLARSQELGLRTATHVLLRAELGRLCFLDQQFERAHRSFAEVRAALAKPEEYDLNESIEKVILGKRKETYGLMARSALEANHLDEAETLFAEAHKDAAETTEALLDRARVLARRDDATATIALLENVLDKPDFGSALPIELLRRALAKSLTAPQIDAAIIERLTPRQAAHPDHAILRLELARGYANQEQLAEAAQLLADVSKKDPSGELRELHAEVLRRQNEPDKWLALVPVAEEELRLAAADKPFSDKVLEIVRGLPADVENHPKLRAGAQLSLARKEAEEATRLWSAALTGNEEEKAEALLLWGLKLTQADEYRLSMAALQRVIDQSAANAGPAYFYLAGSAALAGENDTALEAAQKAIEARPDDVRFIAREAWVLHHARRNAEARTKYEALLSRFEDSAQASVRVALRDARLLLSAICVELGDEDAAIERLEQVLDEFPDDFSAQNDLGYLWADRGQHLQRSLRMVQRAVASEPENAAYRDSLGWVYFRLDRFAEAVVELEAAAGGDRPGGVVLDHLGDALARVGRADEARRAWQRAAEALRIEGDAKRASVVKKKLGE